MAQHLLEAGYPLTVFSRTLEKCQPLVDLGATLAQSPFEVAENSDVVFTIVGFPRDVRSVILGEDEDGNELPEKGVLHGLREGGIVVDMTTSEPSLAVEIAEKALAKGVLSIDAPVSGGDTGARNGTLSIMTGGSEASFETVRPLFEIMGSNVRLMGGPGSGQHTKMVNQTLIATNMIGVVEGLLYAQRAGLDLDQVIQAVGAGAAGSWSINNLGPRIVVRNFEPGFFIDHFVKDLGIVLQESQRMGLTLPGLELSLSLYKSLQEDGLGLKGTQALMLALEKMNNIQHGEEEEEGKN